MHLAADLSHLIQLGLTGGCFFFQTLQLVLCLYDFALQGIIFILPELAAFQLLLCLLLGFLQSFQLFLGRTDGVLQHLLLLGEKGGVFRVEL